MPYKVIKEGERALITSPSGDSRIVNGPRRIYLFNERIQYLNRYTARPDQYLVVKDNNGQIEHAPGPCERFFNPIEYDYIRVQNCIKLDSNHMIVVYKQLQEHIERRIISGPCLFTPGPNEWLHEFIWHGSDGDQHDGKWKPKGDRFTMLRYVPGYMYYNVRDVRTNDDTLIAVKLMMFYELKDVETMLNFTHDPIADFLNAVNSDIVAFASKLTYEEFLQQTEQLSKLDSYPQLVSRAQRIGYNIAKVVYRGYNAPAALQKSHNEAITSRTQLRLKAEEEEMEQNLVELKLKRKHARAKLARDLESTRQENKQKLELMRREHELEVTQLTHLSQLRKEELEKKIALEIEKAKHEMERKYLSELKKLGVDMTKYLVNQQPHYKVNKEIIVGPYPFEQSQV